MMSPRTTNNLLSLLVVMLCCTLIFTACSKGDTTTTNTSQTNTGPRPIANIKLLGSTGSTKKLMMYVSSLGDVATGLNVTITTLSAGIEVDANGILPASMISSTGFVFTGDSVIYNNITITNKAITVTHGDKLSNFKSYGNLAYATVAFGDVNGTKLVTKRIPFFLYYKAIDNSNNQLGAHMGDVFGIGQGTNTGNALITSPLTYLPLSGTQISGFKLGLAKFDGSATQQNACTLQVGLLPADLDATAGFDLHPLIPLVGGGYANYITGTILYNASTITGAQIAFGTGYIANSILQDPKYTNSYGSVLAVNSTVRIITNNGFNFPYTIVAGMWGTSVESPTYSGETRCIFGIDFFTANEFLMDYTDHQIGLKSN